MSSQLSGAFSAKRLLCDGRLQKNKLCKKSIVGHVLDLGINCLFPFKDEKLNPESTYSVLTIPFPLKRYILFKIWFPMFVFIFCCKLYQHLATSSMHDIVQMDGSFITADQFAYRLSRCLQLACISLSWRMAHAAVVWKRFTQTLVQRVFDCRGSWMKMWARILFEHISALRRWTCTSRKWHNFFLRVEEIVVFLYSCCRQGRAFDLPQRCEKNCSHVPSPLNIEQVIGKNCITLEWAIVDKGTSFFHRVGEISISF